MIRTHFRNKPKQYYFRVILIICSHIHCLRKSASVPTILSRMSNAEDTMNESLQAITCSICTEIEPRDVKNDVKLCTNCFQFCCDSCLKKLRKKQYKIPCPFCRKCNLYENYATIPWLREAQVNMKGNDMLFNK